ncbi:MAG TPA: IS91 family transposase [Anaerolineales bacterium]|nr:IS91 family transposase [Anaerolineales bacterium]
MHAHAQPGAPRFDIAHIFRAHGDAFRRTNTLSDEQHRAMWSIEHCRTQTLGGHLYQCQTCASNVPLYNSCLSRFCPTCQGPAQYQWMAQRQQRLLPTHYFHPVFTLPAALRPLAWRYKAVVFDLLFAAAAHTLIDLCRDPTHLGAEIGLSLVLHTWTRELTFHPHVHGILPGGGLARATDPHQDRWVACDKKFLIHVDVLSAVFRGKFLDGLKQAYAHGAFSAHTTLNHTRFQTLLDRLYQMHWNVYVKPPFAGPPAIVKYLGRYTHRTGIANSRLVSVTHDAVTFRTKNGNTCTLPPHEFIRRFLLHVLPDRYTKIRHYGLLAASNVNTKLVRARELIEQNQPPSPPSAPPSLPPQSDTAATATTEPHSDGTANDPAKPKLRCPNCQGTTFSRIATLPRERRRRTQPPPDT